MIALVNGVRHDDIEPFDFGGLKIREVTRSERCSLAEIDVPPGVDHSRARSKVSEKIYVCLSGRVQFIVDERPIEIGPRESLEIPTGTWFEYRNTQSDPARMLLVHVPPFNLADEEFLESKAG